MSILDHEPTRLDEPLSPALETISVVVVDPHPPIREGLSLLLAPEGLTVVGGASTGAAGEALIARHEPNIALIASDLPDVDGIALLRRIVRSGTRSAIVLYADDADCEDSAAAVHAGAAGLVAKRRSIAELADALRSIATGGLWFEERDDDVLAPAPEPVPAGPLPLPRSQRRTSTLSSSELRVLALVAEGGSTEATAEALSLSPHTVRTHLRNVMRKLEASSRAHAVAIAIREAAIEI